MKRILLLTAILLLVAVLPLNAALTLRSGIYSGTTGVANTITANNLTTGTMLKMIGSETAMTSGLYIGLYNGSTAVWKVAESGATTIVPDAVAAIPLYIDSTVTTTGDALKIKVVSGTMSTGVPIHVLDGSTDIYKLGDTGIITMKGGTTIDNTAAAAICNITEDTVRVTGILDVTGNSTLASLDVGGGSGGSGATIAATGAATFDGAVALNGGLTMDTSAFAVADTTGVVTMKGGATLDNNASAAELNITETAVKVTGNFTATGTSTLTGATNLGVWDTGTTSVSAATITSAYYGKVTFVRTEGATAYTLPANGAAAGSWMEFIVDGSDNTAPTWAAATADTLITVNDAQADSVTFGSGHRIGADVKFISNGTYWIAVNVGSTTMTVATN